MFIYKIINVINNKVYIGQTRTNYPNGRWSAHKNKLNNQTHKNPHLLAAWKKYGPDVWKFAVIDEAKTIQELDKKEIDYINLSDSINPQKGYNVASGGTSGFIMPQETKDKISIAFRGRILSDEHKRKIGLAGMGRKCPKTSEQIKKPEPLLSKNGQTPSLKLKCVRYVKPR